MKHELANQSLYVSMLKVRGKNDNGEGILTDGCFSSFSLGSFFHYSHQLPSSHVVIVLLGEISDLLDSIDNYDGCDMLSLLI